MWTKHLTLIMILILTGIGLVSAWNFMSSKPSTTKEAFTEPSTDEDIDYFVAVANALKKVNKSESSAKEVRRIVADMRSKQVKIKDAEHFVRTNGGRTPIKESMESDSNAKEQSSNKYEDENTVKSADAKKPKQSTNVEPEKQKENFEVKQESTTIGASVADKLTRELNDIADRIDEIVEEISKMKSGSVNPTPPQIPTTEGFTNFPSWSSV